MNMLNRLTQPWEHVFDVIAAESRPCRRTLAGISTILNNKSQRKATGLGNLYSQKTGKDFGGTEFVGRWRVIGSNI
jgi:hypothetical protein